MNELINQMPEMYMSETLYQKLLNLPVYGEEIREKKETERLMYLEDIYKIYLPNQMTVEIYSKVYLAILRSLQKKNSRAMVRQQNENYKKICRMDSNSIIGGGDSFLIVGNSGIGKSLAIAKAIELATAEKIIEQEKPYTKIIPCLNVQCPFDCSVKGLLLEILRKIDEQLDTQYYRNAHKSGATTDMLIGSISQIAINHIGLLVVDEIQNVVSHKGGMNLVRMLTQFINNSGISICMVGTPEAEVFFEKEDYLARRALGLKYTKFPYDDYFRKFCRTVFSYQYVKEKTEISEDMIEWLYEHSGGILAHVITILHDAQEIAILTGKEILNLETMNEAYRQRMSSIHSYIQAPVTLKEKRQIKKKAEEQVKESITKDGFSIFETIMIAKKENRDIISLLKEHIQITEVSI